jgi:predicted kinase
VVLVSGVPGTGKSTIAGPLAAELGFALLAKDTIKEVLADELSADPVLTADTTGPVDVLALAGAIRPLLP